MKISSSLLFVLIVFFSPPVLAKGRRASSRDTSAKVDLSTPTKAYVAFQDAVRNSDAALVRRTYFRYSQAPDQQVALLIGLWQRCFQACGGFGREIVEVLDRNRDYPNRVDPNIAYIYFEPAGGCQDYLKVQKEGNEWKFAER